MTRYLLDTNIISNVIKPEPSHALLAWLGAQKDDDLFIASLTVAEIRRGILEKPAGRKRRALEAWFDGREGPQALFAGRVLPFDERAALIWGRLMAEGKARGEPRSPLDSIIAATAEAFGCMVVTDNENDFGDNVMFNPLRRRDVIRCSAKEHCTLLAGQLVSAVWGHDVDVGRDSVPHIASSMRQPER